MSKFTIVILTLIILAGCTKKDRLEDFTNDYPPEKSFFLYPSTLRMVNLKNIQEFNEMIQDMERGRYYSYPNDDPTWKNVSDLEKTLISDGFEEILEIRNQQLHAKVLLLEKRTPILFAFIRNDDMISLLEIEGMINPIKIPKLMENFSEDQFLNIFEIKNPRQNNPHIEHTENKQPE